MLMENLASGSRAPDAIKKARAGNLPHFTGIDSPYEAPESPDLHLDGRESPNQSTKNVISQLLVNE